VGAPRDGEAIDHGGEVGVAAIVRSFEEAGQRLVLRDLGTHHELLLGQVPILSSRALATERAFGEMARELVPDARRILIGGLGFGATLAGALAVVPDDAEVIVVEKLRTVIDLLRTDLAHLSPGALDDPRARLVNDDVAEVIARERELDVILLDVDNGPGWASFRTNARIYAPEGLRLAHDALRPGGALAVWSGYAADAFVGQLRRAGFTPSVVPMKERGVVRARAYVGRR
jgi:predicted membrane-bound spermidine synthase